MGVGALAMTLGTGTDSGLNHPWSLLLAVDGRIELGFCDSFLHVLIGEVEVVSSYSLK